MIFFIIAAFWTYSAENAPQLLLVAIGTILRIMYITGNRPRIPNEVLLIWVLVFVSVFAIYEGEARQGVVKFLCGLLLLGTLVLHVGQRAASTGFARRIPGVRQVTLFGGRALVLFKVSALDRLFLAKQRVRDIEYRYRSRGVLTRSAAISRAYLTSRGSVVIGLLYDGVHLVDRLTAVVSARGEFPKYNFSIASDTLSPRKWYADLLADIALASLLIIPAILSDSVLVPKGIFDILERITS